MVTDKADREGDKSRNDGLERADGFMTPASNKAIRVWAGQIIQSVRNVCISFKLV